MTDSNPTPWDGIPDDPDQSGWHWIGYPKRMEAFHWSAKLQRWRNDKSDAMPFSVELVEYLGPAIPPISRCRDGSRKVAVSTRRIPDHDQIGVTMNDGSTYYLDSYYWHNGAPVFDIVGKTIPEIEAAAKQYRDPKQEE